MPLRRIEGVGMKLHALLVTALDGEVSFTLRPRLSRPTTRAAVSKHHAIKAY
jgi:hypothetical protein